MESILLMVISSGLAYMINRQDKMELKIDKLIVSVAVLEEDKNGNQE